MIKKERFLYVDLLRAWAMTIMIEVHVVNAFIMPEVRSEAWFPFLNFINGLVAPSFIFISGFAFILSSKNGLDEIRSFGKLFRKRLGRIGLIFLVGYLLHIPYYSFRNIVLYAKPAEMKHFYNVDVLQCIGSGLLVLFFLRLFIKPDRIYHVIITSITAIVIILSPVIWTVDFSLYLPLPLACYFNEINGSFFPIFPWWGFLFGGASCCMFFLNYKDKGKDDFFMERVVKYSGISSVILVSLVTWLSLQPWYVIKPSPLFFTERFVIVLLMLGLFRLYYKRVGEKESFFLNISRESLLVYWLHLQVIYRNLWHGKTLENIAGGQMGIAVCLAGSVALFLLMALAAFIWGWIKKKHPDVGRWVFYAVLGGGALKFFVF